MAGYKQTLEGMEPIALFGFDSETLIEDTRRLRSLQLFDQMGIAECELHVEHQRDDYPCYYMASPISTIDLYEQRSIRFCPVGIQPNARTVGLSYYPKAYAFAHHVREWNYSRKEFSYVFCMKRSYKDHGYIWSAPMDTNNHYSDIIIHHEGMITIWEEMRRYGGYYWHVWIPFYNDDIVLDQKLCSTEEQELGDMITIRFKENKLSIMRNLDIIFEKEYTQDINLLNLDTVEHDLSIGGVGTGTRVAGTIMPELTHDRCHIPTTLDNVALFNRFLPDLEVMRLFQKLYNFPDMVRKEHPVIYIDYQDTQPDTRYGQLRDLSRTSKSLIVMGDRNAARYREDGPFKLTHSIEFIDSAPIFEAAYGTREYLLPINNDFTYFQHFKVQHGERGCIFEQENITPYFFSISLWVNSQGGSHKPGYAELVLGAGNSRIQLADNLDTQKWHEIIIRMKSNRLTVIFDSETYADERVITMRKPEHSGAKLGTGRLLIGRNVTEPCRAHLANTIVWDRAISRDFMNAMIDYEHVYYVKGIIMLEGNPMRATVRAYYHHNGQLINEVQSDPATGAYVIHLHDDRPVDIVAIDNSDIRSRLRAYGPIIPWCRPYDVAYLSP